MKTILLAIVFALSAAPARAAFESLHGSARPSGMAGAYTALADDVNSLFFNPAGLRKISHRELSMQYGHLLGGLSDGSNISQGILAFAQPIGGHGTVALGYSSLRLSGLYEERTISLGYGRRLWDDRLAIGVTLKHLHAGYGKDEYSDNTVDSSGSVQPGASDPALAGGAGRSAISFDIGVQYQWTSRIRLGLAALNLNQPSIGISETSPVTRTLALGVVSSLGPGMLSADLSRREALDGYADTIAALGYEFRHAYQKQLLFLRGGGRVGSRDQRQLNVGAGWRLASLQIDYAVTLPFSQLQPANNSHQVSMTYRFGP